MRTYNECSNYNIRKRRFSMCLFYFKNFLETCLVEIKINVLYNG